MSGASEQANGRASGPVLQSVFLAVIDHSAWWNRGCGWFRPGSGIFLNGIEIEDVLKEGVVGRGGGEGVGVQRVQRNHT